MLRDRLAGTRRSVTVVALVALMLAVAPGAYAAVPTGVKAPTGTTGPAPPGEETALMLPYVPTSHRYSCTTIDPADDRVFDEIQAEAASIRATAVCGPDGPAAVITYLEFGDLSAMHRAYGAVAATVVTPSSDCEGDHGWSYGDDTPGGRLLCFITTRASSGTVPATAVLVWTAEHRAVLGVASAEIGDDDAASLSDWWEESAGPTKRYDETGIASPSNRPNEGYDAELRRAIPKQTRVACESGDRTTPDSIGPSLFAHRFFIEAVSVCREPDPAVDMVAYARTTDGVVEDYTAQTYALSDEQLSTAGRKQCPTQSTYSIGKGKAKRVLGTYACYFLDNDDGTQRVVWRWTDTRQDILAIATNDAGDADALRAWWASNRSGPLQP